MNIDKEQQDKKTMKNAAITMSVLWLLTWLLLCFKPDVRGTIGDMFGAVNALFSGFAFLGVIYAILLQRTELALQREELSLTRGELKKSADAQEKSEKALSKQADAMAKTATINSLTASLESLEKRIRIIPRSGESRMVSAGKVKIERLESKVTEITNKLDSLVDEALRE
ncbi:hypothetical protein GLP30_11840 [Photobacterium phosphoreum]|uniref:Uncharacterized protein n=1 Tax=Photobacterium phosphoreum TaxID=659 RepID=A0AAW4ZQU0_PHOPO|nr:hypothetical protein [Photobacterium phosphoreum]MCD9491387.1 hypothetical protein [Photobacterium phosphoreum]MCF2190777.1 hypothetical protein [Photobacterium phosphoreum]MCF2302296.1 hypothetical protein [Photobacterium phosphoreum]